VSPASQSDLTGHEAPGDVRDVQVARCVRAHMPQGRRPRPLLVRRPTAMITVCGLGGEFASWSRLGNDGRVPGVAEPSRP